MKENRRKRFFFFEEKVDGFFLLFNMFNRRNTKLINQIEQKEFLPVHEEEVHLE